MASLQIIEFVIKPQYYPAQGITETGQTGLTLYLKHYSDADYGEYHCVALIYHKLLT